MSLLIRFVSEDWRAYAANKARDAEAWRTENPPMIEFGPFDTVSMDRGRVIGRLAGVMHELARANRDEPWQVTGRQRPYDHLEVLEGG